MPDSHGELCQPPTPHRRRFRLGIAASDQRWPDWVRACVAAAQALRGVDVFRLIDGFEAPLPQRPHKCLVRQLFDHVDQRRLASWLAGRGVPNFAAPMPELPMARWQVMQPDAVLMIGDVRIDEALHSAARFGVWQHLADEPLYDVVTSQSISRVNLTAFIHARPEGIVIGAAEARVHATSAAITAYQREESSVRLLRDAVHRIFSNAWTHEQFIDANPVVSRRPAAFEPGNLALLSTILGQLVPRWWNGRREGAMHAQWTIAITPRSAEDAASGRLDFSNIHWLVPPLSSFVADPFLWRHGDEWVVFAEVLPFAIGRGHIAACKWRPDTGFSSLEPVLAEDCHLSYPFLFEYEGELFLMPERQEGGELTAYSCEEFPLRWRPQRPIMAGLRCVDATLVQHDGRWWLFYTSVHGGASEDNLYACHAPTPFGPWEPHPMNPVRSGLRGARMAGSFIRQSDGRLIRPGQDSSANYGGAVILFEVQSLTMCHFEEREIDRIDPSQFPAPWNQRCHTWNEARGMLVFDALRLVADTAGQ